LLEFSSKTLIMSRRVNGLLQKKLKNGDKVRLAKDLSSLQAKYDKDKAAWARREQALKAEKK